MVCSTILNVKRQTIQYKGIEWAFVSFEILNSLRKNYLNRGGCTFDDIYFACLYFLSICMLFRLSGDFFTIVLGGYHAWPTNSESSFACNLHCVTENHFGGLVTFKRSCIAEYRLKLWKCHCVLRFVSI